MRDKEGMFNCKHCDYRGKFKASLQVHLQGRHGPKNIVCQKCGYRTSSNGSLRTHLKTCKFLETGRRRWQRARDSWFKDGETGQPLESPRTFDCDIYDCHDDRVAEESSNKSTDNSIHNPDWSDGNPNRHSASNELSFGDCQIEVTNTDSCINIT